MRKKAKKTRHINRKSKNKLKRVIMKIVRMNWYIKITEKHKRQIHHFPLPHHQFRFILSPINSIYKGEDFAYIFNLRNHCKRDFFFHNLFFTEKALTFL